MFELSQLEQLVTVAESGTLSKAAERLHLSQPAISRSMQKLEEELQVSLFKRQKNKISLNRNGEMAVRYAKKVLSQSHDLIINIRAFDRSQHTISVASCAPAPLWEIGPMLSAIFPEMTISSVIKGKDQLPQGLNDGTYEIIVTTEPVNAPDIYCVKFGEEHLFFSLPPGHPLSGYKKLKFEDIDGETMLLFSKIGFWHDLHLQKMPNTHFLIQEERFTFNELVKASALPSFTSDIVMQKENYPSSRIIIPIADVEANVTYYCLCKSDKKKELLPFFQELEKRIGV